MKTRVIRWTVLSGFTAFVLWYAVGFGDRDFENLCPFGGVASLYGLVTGGEFTCSLGPANLSLLIGIIVLALIAKRAFCGWVCPLGFIGELIYRLREKVTKKRVKTIPPRLNAWLKPLRYIVLVLVLYFTWQIGDLVFRGFDPFYAIFSGMGHGTLGWITWTILAIFLIGSWFVPMFFCRYFCPLGATLDPFGWLGLIKVSRNAETCIDCNKCHKVCPHDLHPEKVDVLRHHDCTNCMECIDACPIAKCMTLKAKV